MLVCVSRYVCMLVQTLVFQIFRRPSIKTFHKGEATTLRYGVVSQKLRPQQYNAMTPRINVIA